MTAISRNQKNSRNTKEEGKIAKISKTSFKSSGKKNLQKIISKSDKSALNQKTTKKKVISQLKNANELSSNVSKDGKPGQKAVKKKHKLQSQKEYMKRLRKKDPEFFKIIMNNKDVLEGTGYSDEEGDDDSDEITLKEDEISMDKEEESCYDWEEDSCEEEENSLDEEELDSEDEREDSNTSKEYKVVMDSSDEEQNHKKIKNSGKITKNMINEWKISIRNSKTLKATFKCTEQALAAAIISIKGSEDDNLHSRYTVEGSQIFNLVVKFCLSEVAPALHKLFNLKSLSDRPSKNANWKKLAITNTTVKNYLKHLILLTKSITEADGIVVLLKKGILPVLPIYVELPAVAWNLMKHMISLWCTSFEKVRVLSLVAIFRLIRSFKDELREKCMKALYTSYVKNCHFTSPVSWPMIDFMRMSLVELYCLDQPLAYRHAFIYIRQLALHLRNALLVQKKDRVQLVYNWQFIHCIRLWAEVLGRTHPSKVLQPLIYPLVQVSIGTINLMKTPKYFPLVFHVCNILTELSKSTDTFIPVMPPLLEILDSNRVHNRQKKTSMKPLQWDSVIKVSTSQMNESAFSDGVIDQVYDCLLTYLDTECASIGFPELVFIATLKIKSFHKKCKVPSYIKKMKHFIDIINENSLFIEQRRKDVQFSISDAKAIKDWEIATLQASPPIHTFYSHLKKIKDKNIKIENSTNNDIDLVNSEALLKEKLAVGSQKKVGHHLLVKKDEDLLEMISEEVEENLEEIAKDEDVHERTKLKKRKEVSSTSSNDVTQSKKKKKISISDENENLEDDVIEMTFSDKDESSAEEENGVEDEDSESEGETENEVDEESEDENEEDEESEAEIEKDEESEDENEEDEESEAEIEKDEESEAEIEKDEESETENEKDEESEDEESEAEIEKDEESETENEKDEESEDENKEVEESRVENEEDEESRVENEEGESEDED